MRVVIKGGVWKNTEDEILKAAVMKYGKNQWARISSLLVRKTPKQCKARWYEWLDPSIKKTEWSKQEDEKLLHLAKLMPTQWRTIAPIVGRTSSQCLDRYQKLLDEAEQSNELKLIGGDSESGPSADDIRRLRPGEIDPDPETKPARPDPVDMDEDEKEMLSEARARLANTQGKKAKRKAREKQIGEAKRLATMQKNRELKAAGIDMGFKRKLKGMDYNADIPFERQPLRGAYEVDSELNKQETLMDFNKLRLQNLEPKKRHELQSDVQKAYDLKVKSNKEKGIVNDLALQKMLEDEVDKISSNRKKLVLPTPQIGDKELDEIIKLNGNHSYVTGDDDSGVTNGLINNYDPNQHQQFTPLRTPSRTPNQIDFIKQEALNLIALTNAQTPLLGEHVEQLNSGTGFQSSKPNVEIERTPNPFLNHQQTPQSNVRDNFNINQYQNDLSTPQIVNLKETELKNLLQKGLASLPTPKNEFQIMVPDSDSDSEDLDEQNEISEEDALDRDLKIAKRIFDEEQALLKQRSQSLKLNLPRPLNFDSNSYLSTFDDDNDLTELELADKMILEETIRLLQYESVIYPPSNGNNNLKIGKKFDLSSYDIYDDDLLKEARDMIEEELQSFNIDDNELMLNDLSSLNFNDLNEYKKLFDQNKNYCLELGKKVGKNEKKLGIKLGGYMAKSKQKVKIINQLFDLFEEKFIENESVKLLKLNEQIGGKNRIEKLQNEVDNLIKKEQFGQDRYRELSEIKDELMEKINNSSYVISNKNEIENQSNNNDDNDDNDDDAVEKDDIVNGTSIENLDQNETNNINPIQPDDDTIMN